MTALRRSPDMQYRRLDAKPVRPAVPIAAAIPLTTGRASLGQRLALLLRLAVGATDVPEASGLR